MKEVQAKAKPRAPMPTALDLQAEILELEADPYVRLARAEEQARAEASRYLQQLRELERRGRFLASQGVTLEKLGAEE